MIHERFEHTQAETGKWVKWTLRENKCTLGKATESFRAKQHWILIPSHLLHEQKRRAGEREVDAVNGL